MLNTAVYCTVGWLERQATQMHWTHNASVFRHTHSTQVYSFSSCLLSASIYTLNRMDYLQSLELLKKMIKNNNNINYVLCGWISRLNFTVNGSW